MLLKELLLTDIAEVSENELKYKVMDLNTYKTFTIFDRMEDKPNYQFIFNIFLDNAIMPPKRDVKTFQRLIRKNPLYFNAVYLVDGCIEDINDPIPLCNDVEDFAIIPNVEARGFARCKEQLHQLHMSIENLKGRY